MSQPQDPADTPSEREPQPQPEQEREPELAAEPAPADTSSSTRPARMSAITRSVWLPAATGLAGLLLGIVIGAVGIGLLGSLWLAASHHRGDDRGHYWQDHRPPCR